MSNQRPRRAALHTPLGTALVAALAVGWAVAGAAYLTDAPLLVGSVVGLCAALVAIALWRVDR